MKIYNNSDTREKYGLKSNSEGLDTCTITGQNYI